MSVRIDPTATPTRLRSYYDQAALDDQLGPNAEQDALDRTDGLGSGFRDASGRLMRRDSKGEVHEMSAADAQHIIDRNSVDLGELGPNESPDAFEERT